MPGSESSSNFFPPGLVAQYRGYEKTCQEKIDTRPQNVRLKLSKASIRSVICADSNNSGLNNFLLDRNFLFGNYLISLNFILVSRSRAKQTT